MITLDELRAFRNSQRNVVAQVTVPHDYFIELCDLAEKQLLYAGRRAPVQGVRGHGIGPGTVPWETHLAAWSNYAACGHGSQDALRLAARAGFSYRELQCALAGHYNDCGYGCKAEHPVPPGWIPGGAEAARDEANKLDYARRPSR